MLFEKGSPGQSIYKALDRGDILLSEEVAQEINEVLSREKFSRYVTSFFKTHLCRFPAKYRFLPGGSALVPAKIT